MADLTNSQAAMANALQQRSANAGATIFDSNQPMSFAAQQFPFEKYEVTGEFRDHIFEYPHSPGGAPEKLGRSLYRINVDATFDGALILDAYSGTKLWPDGFNIIRKLYETGQTDDLMIPTLGILPAYIKSFKWTETNMIRSGVKASITFVEDSSASFIASQIAAPTMGALEDRASAAKSAWDQFPRKINILEQINELVADVVAYKDTLVLYSMIFESKVLSLLQALSLADSIVSEFNDPKNILGLDALHLLWESTRQLRSDLQSTGVEMRTFIVPRALPLGAISQIIYGDSTHSGDLMGLNVILDPFNIPAGQRLRYYPSSPGAGAMAA